MELSSTIDVCCVTDPVLCLDDSVDRALVAQSGGAPQYVLK